MTLDNNIIDKRSIKFFENLEIKLNILHNGKYDYSETIYKTKRESITYKCNVHGYVTQNAGEHIRGHGCRLCGVEFRKNQTKLKYEKTLINNSFISEKDITIYFANFQIIMKKYIGDI